MGTTSLASMANGKSGGVTISGADRFLIDICLAFAHGNSIASGKCVSFGMV
jgi:hypothetical protein